MLSKLYFSLIILILCLHAEEKVTIEKINEGIAKGTNYLILKQSEKGMWKEAYADSYPMGETALVTLTLMKCNISPEDDKIKKAFQYLDKLPIQKTYGAALYLMAIDAKFKLLGDKIDAKIKKRYKKFEPFRLLANYKDKKRAKKVLDFIQNSIIYDGVWGYPGGSGDHSNTQYAMLGLAAAERMGLSVDKKIYHKVVRHFIETQEKIGPTVSPFFVPAADEPIDWQWRQKLEEKIAQLKKRKQEKLISKVYPRYTKNGTMKARGWKYTKEEGKTTGSMTSAGIACMVIAKAYLEESPNKNWQKLLPEINESIRDGCAWLAHNFQVKNPNGGNHYYYLYGLERAGILSGVEMFSGQNWYLAGAEKIIKDQKDNGSIKDTLTDTCFALLFLKRATIPLRIETKK